MWDPCSQINTFSIVNGLELRYFSFMCTWQVILILDSIKTKLSLLLECSPSLLTLPSDLYPCLTAPHWNFNDIQYPSGIHPVCQVSTCNCSKSSSSACCCASPSLFSCCQKPHRSSRVMMRQPSPWSFLQVATLTSDIVANHQNKWMACTCPTQSNMFLALPGPIPGRSLLSRGIRNSHALHLKWHTCVR